MWFGVVFYLCFVCFSPMLSPVQKLSKSVPNLVRDTSRVWKSYSGFLLYCLAKYCLSFTICFVRVLHIYRCFCCVCCLPGPHAPILKRGGLRPPPRRGRAVFGRPPPFVESLMDGCVGAGKAADAAKSCINMWESRENRDRKMVLG